MPANIEDIPETPYAYRWRLQFIFEVISDRIREKGDNLRVLDVGCGTGEYVTIPLGSLGVNVLGIDVHCQSIQHAKENNPYSNVEFKCVSIDEIESSSFDIVICSEVLEHLEEPDMMLRELKRVLKSDGLCIITIPNGYGPKEIEGRIYKVLKGFFDVLYSLRSGKKRSEHVKDSFNTSPHIQFFTYKTFKDLVERCGFCIVKSENRRFLGGPLSSIFLYRSNRLIEWNVRVAKRIPHFLASGWMFVLRPIK